MEKINKLDTVIDQIIETLGNTIVLGAPLGLGKPNHLINALYKRVKKNKKLSLTICTALTLERPKPKSDLEKRFLGPFAKRVFGDYPDLSYEIDRVKGKLPANIKVIEFYFAPGKYLNDKNSQQNYVSSNFTHVCRDMLDQNINLIMQMVSAKEDKISFSCNADTTNDIIPLMRGKDYPSLVIGQINQNLPFMYGDAEVDAQLFDIIVDRPDGYYKLFGPPKMSIPDADYMIGLYASSLVKDDGEIQVGIGSLGDAVIYGLTLREKNNDIYNKLLEETGFKKNFETILSQIGETGGFTKGLFGATEMMVDGFMELYNHKILKKQVYDHVGIQRLINQDLINPTKLSISTILQLIDKKIIHAKLNKEDFNFLIYWGIFKEDTPFREGVDLQDDQDFIQQNLGHKIKHGHVMHAGFYLGPQKFYKWLKELPEEERKLFSMKSVLKINQLYGHEVIDRLHRKNARFINTCMMTTLSGAHVSDGVADGRVVSGVGGQYNFVAMAQELPDGHSVITMRSTRTKNGVVRSNIVFNYGHITVPRHMRDILVTEYGVAHLRGKTDEQIIIELLKVSDSRFQDELMKKAKSAGKLKKNFKLDQAYKQNYPKSYEKVLDIYKKEELFSKFPFGTDLTEEEIVVGAALKKIKAEMDKGKISFIKLILSSYKVFAKPEHQIYLERLGLEKPRGIKQRLYRKLICSQL